jgi:putative transposase
MTACQELCIDVGATAACEALDIARPTFYRRIAAFINTATAVRSAPPRALSVSERQIVLDVLHTDRFVDKAPTEVYATLLDEDTYHCSPRTMYRILAIKRIIHTIRLRNSWQPPPIKSGRGILRNCLVRSNGPIFTFT